MSAGRVIQGKVALFMPTLGGGGAEHVMLVLAELFMERGLHVDIVVSAARGALRGSVPPGARVVDLGASRLICSVWPLARYLRRERPGCMLSVTTDANCVAVWARALARMHSRMVVSQRDAMSAMAADEPARRKRLLPWLARWTYPHADAVTAVSAGVADDLAAVIDLPRPRIRVIYNPIDLARVRALSREPLDHPWFRRGQPPVVLAVGRFAPEKDFPTLIRGFGLLRQRQPARLMILGDGAGRTALTKLIRELGIDADVALPGFASNPYRFMRAAAVFALSSRFEGLPNVLIEALACGPEIVSTDCPSGPAEILDGGRWGRLVPIGQPVALASALQAALERAAPKPQIDDALQRFNSTEIVRQYMDVLGLTRHAARPAQ